MSTADTTEKQPEEETGTKLPKIDSLEKFNVWLNSFSPASRSRLVEFTPDTERHIERSADGGWWLRRERARTMYEFGQAHHALPSSIYDSFNRYGVQLNPFHFVHLSISDPTKVAFTESWEAGIADRQQQISLGKYLKKYHPQVPEFAVKQMQEYLNGMTASAEVNFTSNLEEMILWYTTIAPACMSKDTSAYKTNGIHPLSAYVAPGFALATLNVPKLSKHPVARSMTWVNPADEADKRYVRIYGEAMLAAQLDKRGYRRAHFSGAKLKRVNFQVGRARFILCPYVDDHSQGAQGTGVAQSVVVHEDHLEIVLNNTSGALPATSASGCIREPAWTPPLVRYHIIGPHEDYTFKSIFDRLTPCELTGRKEVFFSRRADGGFDLGVLGNYGGVPTVEVRRFRTLADLDSYTPLKNGMYCRLDGENEEITARAWQVSPVIGDVADELIWAAGAGVGTSGAFGEFFPLEPQVYSNRVIAQARRSYYAPASETALAMFETDGRLRQGRALKRDTVEVTHGSQAGQLLFRHFVAFDSATGDSYYSRDLSHSSTGFVPTEALVDVYVKHHGSIGHHDGRGGFDEATGLPRNIPTGFGVRWIDTNRARRYDFGNEFILRHHERGIPVIFDAGAYDTVSAVLASHVVVFTRILARDLRNNPDVEEVRTVFEYSDKPRSVEDLVALQKFIASLRANSEKMDYAQMSQAFSFSFPYIEQDSWLFSRDVMEDLARVLFAGAAKELNGRTSTEDLDSLPQTQETPDPQPKVAPPPALPSVEAEAVAS